MQFNKKSLVAMLTAAVAASVLVGCGGDGGDDSAPLATPSVDTGSQSTQANLDAINALPAVSSTARSAVNVGEMAEQLIADNASSLFGTTPIPPASNTPRSADRISPSATTPTGFSRNLDPVAQPASDQVLLSDDLTVTYLTREAGQDTDMMEFLPIGSSTPTHLITCVEEGLDTLSNINDDATPGDNRLIPSVQRINLTDASVETVLRGMDRCDGIRVTAWGTVIATEETSSGAVYEILNPLTTLEHSITSRGEEGTSDATIVDNTAAPSTAVVKRTAMPIMAWEGLTVLSNGVVIGGDELRPGSTAPDTDGGAIFKFVPTTLRADDAGNITSLDQSPLVAGTSYALQISCRDSGSSSFGQTGQGCEVGHGQWIEIDAANARTSANTAGASGYYRPEDLHIDPNFSDDNIPAAIRFCFANTGNARGDNFGEVICVVDNDPGLEDATIQAGSSTPPAVLNRFIEGDTDFNQPDNLAFHPQTGNLYVIEDNSNGDIFACLPDGADRDIKSDGCIKILSVVDSTAEPTGFIFHPNGIEAFVVIQHSNDDGLALTDNFRTDDVLRITGFTLP